MRLRSNFETGGVPGGQDRRTFRNTGTKRTSARRQDSIGPKKKRRTVGSCAGQALKKRSAEVPSTSALPSKRLVAKMAIGEEKAVETSKTAIECSSPVTSLHINSLPPHIMVSVFTMLSVLDRIRVERVCRRWRVLAKHYAWTSTRSFSYTSLIEDKPIDDDVASYNAFERPLLTNKEVKSLMERCGKYIEELDLHAFRDTLTYNVCSSFALYTQKLHSINMMGILLTNSSLQLLGRHCPYLEKVNFRRCFQETVVERGLSAFLSKCTRLKDFDVGENERLTGSPSFWALPRTLTTLNFGGCYRLNGAALHAITQRCSDVVNLTMNSVDGVPTSDINEFFGSLSKLEVLKYGECFVAHTDHGNLEVNFSALRNLRELSINDNLLITNRILRTTVNGCQQLVFLDLSGCNRFVNNDGVLELTKLPHLKHVNLSSLRSLTNQTLKALALRGILQSVLVHGCPLISDESIKYLLDHCPNLVSLDVSHCPNITDQSIDALVDYVCKRAKREESFPRTSRMKRPSGRSLAQLFRHDRSLQSLMDPDFERHILRYGGHYRIEDSYETLSIVSTRENFIRDRDASVTGTELHVWIGHTSVTEPLRTTHPLLIVSGGEHFDDAHTPFVEFSLLIRIN